MKKGLKRFYHLYITNIRMTTRVRVVLFFTIVFPLIFIGIFGIAFQASDPANTTIELAVVNYDQGLPSNITFVENSTSVTGLYYNKQFTDILSTITFDDNETKIFRLVYYSDVDIAMQHVEKREQAALLVIPEDFSLAVLASRRAFLEGKIPMNWTGFPPANYTTELKIKGDSTLVQFSIASTVLNIVVNRYFVLEEETTVGAKLEVEGDISSKGLTIFDYTAPGLVIFAILGNLSTVTVTLLRDMEDGQFERLKLTEMKIHEYILAIIISQLTVSLVQVPIMFGTAVMFGFPLGISLVYAFLFGILVSLSVSAIGIILAAMVSTTEAASSLSAIVSTPLAFLAGAFFTMPNPIIIPQGGILGENSFGVFDLIPARPAITALRVVLLTDRGMSSVMFEFWVIIVEIVIYGLLGILLFKHKHLKPQ